MKSLYPTIKKLLTAINGKGYLLLVNRKMVYSEKIDRMCTVLELNQLIPIDQYYENHPDKKRRKNDNRKFVSENIDSSFKEIDILRRLVEIWGKVKDGEKYGEEAKETEE